MKRFKKRYIFLLFIVSIYGILSIPELVHENEGTSKSIGSVRNGSLENGYILPYRGANFKYFSPFSYFIFNNGYTHSTLHKVILEAYEKCETTCPDVDFKIMESTNKSGGKILFHRTHQNGYGIDFMIPKLKRNGNQSNILDRLGMLHYLLSFDDDGYNKILSDIRLDFETMGKHILAIDDSANANGLRIRKIILKVELKDDLYATVSGKEIQKRGIYLVRSLSRIVNEVHDDHYHIDFEAI